MIFPLLGSSIKLIVDESLAGCGWRYHAAEGGLDVEGEVLHPRGVVLPRHVRVHLLMGMKQRRCAQLQKMPQNYFSYSLGYFHSNYMSLAKNTSIVAQLFLYKCVNVEYIKKSLHDVI